MLIRSSPLLTERYPVDEDVLPREQIFCSRLHDGQREKALPHVAPAQAFNRRRSSAGIASPRPPSVKYVAVTIGKLQVSLLAWRLHVAVATPKGVVAALPIRGQRNAN